MHRLSFTALISLWLVTLCHAQTIDEIIAGASNNVKEFEIMDDLSSPTRRVELDMVLTREQYHNLLELNRARSDDDPTDHSRSKRKAIKQVTYRWDSNEVPYKVEPNVFSDKDMAQINMAIREWETNTCIRFRPAQRWDSNYISFGDGSGCSSYVGMSKGKHPIALAGGCRFKGVIAHEMGHAIGFFHEQNRPDRDGYIIIQKQNIIHPNLYHNFDKYPWSSVSTYDVPYDYKSIMHYGGRAFSGNGEYTIKTVDPAYQDVIGNREALSFRDIKLANLMYECNKGCDTSIRCPGEGFVGKDCKCWCPGNPIQLCSEGTATTPRPTTVRTVTTTTPRYERCQDMNQHCSAWADAGYCRTNTYVKTYCKKACSLCGTATTPAPTCVDVKDHCKFWAGQGYCTGIYANFMAQNCQMSCDLCYLNTQDDNGVSAVSVSIVSLTVGVIFALSSFMS